MKLRILALDFATTTGFAYYSETLEASGIWDLSIRKDESGGMRLIRFEYKIKEIIKLGVDIIVFEAVSVGSGPKVNMDGIKLGSKLQAIIERIVEITDGLECRSYNLTEIKKHAIPEKGVKKNKEAMIAAAKEKWPNINIIDDNMADALFLLSLAQKELGI